MVINIIATYPTSHIMSHKPTSRELGGGEGDSATGIRIANTGVLPTRGAVATLALKRVVMGRFPSLVAPPVISWLQAAGAEAPPSRQTGLWRRFSSRIPARTKSSRGT